jgi:hypothetical protein
MLLPKIESASEMCVTARAPPPSGESVESQLENEDFSTMKSSAPETYAAAPDLAVRFEKWHTFTNNFDILLSRRIPFVPADSHVQDWKVKLPEVSASKSCDGSEFMFSQYQ